MTDEQMARAVVDGLRNHYAFHCSSGETWIWDGRKGGYWRNGKYTRNSVYGVKDMTDWPAVEVPGWSDRNP